MNKTKIKSYLYPKQKFIYLVLFLGILGCGHHSNYGIKNTENQISNNMSGENKPNLPELLFDSLTHDFGEVIQGEQLDYTFYFKNVGKSTLIISEVRTSCGCITPVPAIEPVPVGEEGEIPITFNTTNKSGEVTTYVVVGANTYPAQTVLTIKANVKERK